jgi:hypothetical protein
MSSRTIVSKDFGATLGEARFVSMEFVAAMLFVIGKKITQMEWLPLS